MAGCRIILFLILFSSTNLFGQVNRYIVFFKDKANSPYSIDQPEQYLSQKSLDRRSRQKIVITTEDLPVNPAYINEVNNTGARTFFASRWMNCLLVEIGADSVGLLQALPAVSKIELVAPGKKLSGGRVGKLNNIHGRTSAAATLAQLHQVGIDEMQSQGYTGQSITMAVLDAGFQGVNSAVPFQDIQVASTFDFVGNTGNVYQYDSHGTEVLSVIGANIPGTFNGGAPACHFYLFVTEDASSEYRIEEYNWLFGAEKADSAGVDIISTSLGYNTDFDDPTMNYSVTDMDGLTTVITRAATGAISRGMVVACSAGNEGNNAWHTITAPADAVGILSCGAVDSQGLRATFSSVGPSADGRIKPEVVALGLGTAVVTPAGNVISGNGSSFACPLVASLAAGVWQAFPDLTAQEVSRAIALSADQASAPDNQRGYGLPNFVAVKHFLETAEINDPVQLFPNPSQSSLQVLFKLPADGPFTITIYDRLGRTLSESSLEVTWRNNPVPISIESMTSGMYFMKIKSQSLVKTFKWVKD